MLRFKNDDGSEFPEWEEHEIAELIQLYDEKVSSDCQLPILTSSKKNGIEYQEEHFTGKQRHDIEGYNVLPRNYCTYRNRSDGTDFTFNINKLCDKGIVSKFYPVFKEKDCDLFFLVSLLNNERKTVRKIAYTAKGTGQKVLSITDLRNITVNMPSLPEQQKIAEFLSTIDTVIEKQKETVSAWEERKKGVMQKLFSQEVRFKADDGSEFPEWEGKNFSDVFENLNNSTFSRDCLNYEAGNVKYIHYGDILIKFGFAIDVQSSNVPYVNKDLDCEKYASLSDGDIVIADTAEDDTAGKAVEIMNTHCRKTISGLHTIACHPREKFASKYLGYFMNADIYHNQLRPYMQGIKVTSVSKTNISLTKISVPCLAEQQKIADCLSSLDDVIEKQKATLAAWEELKKGLLQQMFV